MKLFQMEQGQLRKIPIQINLLMLFVVMLLLAILSLELFTLDEIILGKDYLAWQMLIADFVRQFKVVFIVSGLWVFFLKKKKKHRIILVGSSIVGYLVYSYLFFYFTPW